MSSKSNDKRELMSKEEKQFWNDQWDYEDAVNSLEPLYKRACESFKKWKPDSSNVPEKKHNW